MATSIFVNVPVKDLPKSKAFFSKLGYTFNAQFTNENAAGMVVSDTIYFMLLTEEFFKTFTKKTITDTSKEVEAIFALSAESKEAVDQLVEKAIAAGGTEPKQADDKGFMYTRTFEDLDSHTWEILYMDPDYVH